MPQFKFQNTMKKITSTLAAILLINLCFSQILYQKNIRSRIDFKEKMNTPAKIIPTLLLKAFCNGEIQAYYPNAETVSVNCSDFLAQFGMVEPIVLSTSGGDQIPCISQIYLQLDPNLLRCFSYYMDVDESWEMDSKTSRLTKRIKYVRLIYSAWCSSMNFDYNGPVFKYSDIDKLNENYRVPNPQNLAINLKIGDFFKIRPYNAVIIKGDGKYFDNRAKEEKKLKEKNINNENFMWEY